MTSPRTVLMVLLVTATTAACARSHPAEPKASARDTPPAPSTSATTTTVVRPREPSRPPYPVTEITLHLIDTSRPTISHGRLISSTRSLVTLLWMPARPGRSPLVVFAHGFQVGPGPYTTLLEAWAAHGYAVAAPEFPLTDASVAGPNLDESDIDNQPADVRFVTDYLVSPRSPVAGRLDPSQVAIAGHSDGAETALGAGTTPGPRGAPVYRAIIAFGVQPVPGAAGHKRMSRWP
jgi:predicted dienelactone hydrolase